MKHLQNCHCQSHKFTIKDFSCFSLLRIERDLPAFFVGVANPVSHLHHQGDPFRCSFEGPDDRQLHEITRLHDPATESEEGGHFWWSKALPSVLCNRRIDSINHHLNLDFSKQFMILRIFEMWFTSMDEMFCSSASEEEEDMWKVAFSTESSSV